MTEPETGMNLWWIVTCLLALAMCGVAHKEDWDPCRNHHVLDDARRSPLYQPQTPADVLCDRQLTPGWYRFTINNRSAEIPTRCVPVNYCGTQAPLWLRLDGDRATACSAWSDGSDESDCCAIEYPINVRNCSSFVVYQLEPPAGCNMAYCAHLAGPNTDDFAFEDQPQIDAVVDPATGKAFFNCSIEPVRYQGRPVPLRFNWIKVSPDGHQMSLQTTTAWDSYHLLARHALTVGDKVLCHVEALLTEVSKSHGTVNPSISSQVFHAGIVIHPLDTIRLFKNGIPANISVATTVPFLCAIANTHDCHLTVELVQHQSRPHSGRNALAVSQCQLTIRTGERGHSSDAFVVMAVTDLVSSADIDVTVQLVVTSYGDAWWYGYQLPNITVQVRQVEPVQCYAFTLGHVIDVHQSVARLQQPGRHLLYENAVQSLRVWTEYEKCSSEKAVCICSLEVRHLGQVYTLERCSVPGSVSEKNSVRSLPQMALMTDSSARNRMRVLESRKGQIITLIFSYGGRVRIRMEEWGLSVSVVDVGQESQQTLDAAIGGLCNNKGMRKSFQQRPFHPASAPLVASGELCTCAYVEKAYLSNAITNHPLCDPDLEDCSSDCQAQAAVQWEPLLNYVDISDQIRTRNPLDHPQSDSAHPGEPNDIVPAPAAFRQPPSASWSTSPNLGRDVHWTVRVRRQSETSFTWSADEVSFYCANFLVNSTVALECGHYLTNSVMTAIDICTQDVSESEDPRWAQQSLGLLEDQCEVEATYRQSTWSRDLLGRTIVPAAIVEALNCPNRCSHHGVCLQFGCVCQLGFSGVDCSLMDDTTPTLSVVGVDGLCDLRETDCQRISVSGSGFINSSKLRSQIYSGYWNGSIWYRNNQSVGSTVRFDDSERVTCQLQPPSVPANGEIHLEIRISNDGFRFSSAGYLTLFHSGCRSCSNGKESRSLCVDREDVCRLDGSCFRHGQRNPRNSCQICLLDRNESWSERRKSNPPAIPTQLKTAAYDGQFLEYNLPVSEVDGDPLLFQLADPFTDAMVSTAGVFRWRAVSNAPSVLNHETFSISVRHECGPPVLLRLRIDVFPCPCGNGGICQPFDDVHQLGLDFDWSNRIASYRCQCQEGFEGTNCNVRIRNRTCNDTDHCQPAEPLASVSVGTSSFTTFKPDGCTIPCQNGGRCLRRNRCKCPFGFAGRQCQWVAPVCSPVCQNGGHCSRRKSCTCKNGWTGPDCSIAVCVPPCLNGGSCLTRGKCSCPPGYEGKRCQKAVCKPKCRRGGKCIGPGVCLCTKGFTGSNCQTRVARPTRKRKSRPTAGPSSNN